MPHDPRPVSEGGNRGAGDTFQLQANKKKFRVVKVDTFDGGDWIHGEYASKDEAIANCKGGSMLKAYVYDDQGNQLYSAGSF